MMEFFDIITEYGSRMVDGAMMTLTLTGLATLAGGVLSLPLAMLRLSHYALVSLLARLYISFFRGTPMLAQLFLFYYGAGEFRDELDAIGLWWIFDEPFNCAVLTFTLNTLAYQAEIIRGGIQAVDSGQIETGRAIGMSSRVLYLRIILPHAYRISFPALGNEVILLLKGGAIASVVTILDLMGQTKGVFAATFDFSIYIWAAVMYLAIATGFVQIWKRLERLLNPHIQSRSTG